MNVEILNSETRTIEAITAEIHSLEGQAEFHMLSALERKVEIGRKLIEAKEALPHGKFLGWAEREFGWTPKHINNHMKLAANMNRVSHLPPGASLRMALAAIAPEKTEDGMDVHYSSESPEWYTPPEIITATLKLLGEIDLDPCSNSGTVPNVPATERFTEENDGLANEWHGRIYMNPPYGRAIGEWVDKLVSEYANSHVTEAIALVPARVDTEWFRKFRDCAICFVDGRLKFSGHENSAPFPSAVAYLGSRLDSFYDAFSETGDVWIRWKR